MSARRAARIPQGPQIYIIGQTRQELGEVIDQHIAPLEGVTEIDVREPVGSAKQRFDLVWIT